jgi:TRAP-type C4-dicarboxylate transport system substrate-binding protein
MKKISLLMAIILIVALVFSGCSKSGDDKGSESAGPTEATAPTETLAPTQSAEPTPAQQEPMTLKANYFFAETIPPGMGMIHAADEIAEKTDGAITIDNYFSGTLVSYTDEFSATSKGLIDIALVEAGQVTLVCNMNKVFSLPLKETPPDVYTLSECYRQLVDEVPDIQGELEKMNLHWISVFGLPGYNYHGTKISVDEPEDLKGIKMEALGEGVNYLNALGAAAVALDPGDYYMSLERGMVQGQLTHWALVSIFQTQELCTHHTIFGDGDGGLYSPLMGYIINLDTWNSLTPETQDIFETAYINASIYELELDEPSIQSAIDFCTERGDDFVHLTDEEREVWTEYMDPTIDNWISEAEAAGYSNGQDVYDTFMDILSAAG